MNTAPQPYSIRSAGRFRPVPQAGETLPINCIVNGRVTQGAQAADDIARSIVGVEEVSADVGRESRELSESAQNSSQMAQDFSDMMQQFKV